ncbi:hypothetical protein I317_00252 [Kwoniella heveanensis CBS 569]|nr:hypothetical protein I317_00252 [Kwoniella heveanensis CBS 569]
MAPVLSEEEATLDPYKILEVTSDANEKDIQRAYRKKSLKCHPDRNPTPEAAIQFREISVSLEILTNPAKRSYVDNKLESDRKKRERYAEMDKKRKEMVDALNAREEEAKRAKVDQVKKRQQAAEEEAIQDAGRRLLEEAQRKATAAAAAASSAQRTSQANGSSSSYIPANGSGNGNAIASSSSNNGGAASGSRSISQQPEITPVDLTLVITLPTTSTISSTEDLTREVTARYGPISQCVFTDPPKAEGKKKKAKKGIVEFELGNWGGCWACWKDIESANGKGIGGEGGKVRWAKGETPAWIEWAETQRQQQKSDSPLGSSQNGSTTSTSNYQQLNGHSSTFNTTTAGFSLPTHPSDPFSSASFSFDSAPDFSTSNGNGNGISMASILATHNAKRSEDDERRRKAQEFESMTLLRMRQMERERLEEQIRKEEGDD